MLFLLLHLPLLAVSPLLWPILAVHLLLLSLIHISSVNAAAASGDRVEAGDLG